MERRFELRCEEMLAQAVASPDLLKDLLPRLEAFAEPFSESLRGHAQREHVKEHALVNMRLYLPQDWTRDIDRCRHAGVPEKIKFRTRHKLALEMLDEVGHSLPHAWIAGDDEMGRPSHFREELRSRQQRYVLAVPSNTRIRDLEALTPEYGGKGRPPKTPFTNVKKWCDSLPESAWTKIDVRDGEKGPLVIEVVKCRVQAMSDKRGPGPEELLFATREHFADGTIKYDYYLSNAPPETPLEELSRVVKAAHRIEECLKRAKGETGLADYQVRNWHGWHQHQTLSLLATWFLNQETRRGKNTDTRIDAATITATDWRPHHRTTEIQPTRRRSSPGNPMAATQRAGAILSSPQT